MGIGSIWGEALLPFILSWQVTKKIEISVHFQTWIPAVSFLTYATCVPPSCTEGSLCVSRLQKLQVVQQAQRHIVALSCSLQALYCLKSR